MRIASSRALLGNRAGACLVSAPHRFEPRSDDGRAWARRSSGMSATFGGTVHPPLPNRAPEAEELGFVQGESAIDRPRDRRAAVAAVGQFVLLAVHGVSRDGGGPLGCVRNRRAGQRAHHLDRLREGPLGIGGAASLLLGLAVLLWPTARAVTKWQRVENHATSRPPRAKRLRRRARARENCEPGKGPADAPPPSIAIRFIGGAPCRATRLASRPRVPGV
jgi:hypothetical protein